MRFKIILRETGLVAHTFYAANWIMAGRLFNQWVLAQNHTTDNYELDEY